jgi:hypothetical protein
MEQRTLTQMRQWFLIDTLLVLLAGVQLYILTGQTERFFAWTIASPLTAAFLGAAYFASVPLVLDASRQTIWARARMAVPGVFVFTTLTLVATLLHLDKFHLSSPNIMARLAAWVWLAVYLSVPVWLVVIGFIQMRVPGSEPPRLAPLPGWLRVLLGVQAGVLLLVGLGLFIAPTAGFWPWALTPLTGRAVGAWCAGIGIIAGQMAWENDWLRLRGARIGMLVLALLQLAALLRYGQEVRWGVAAVLYVLFLLSVLVVGVYGIAARRGQGADEPPVPVVG